MPDNTTIFPRSYTSEIQQCATRLVRNLRRNVLITPGRRAAVRAALGREPGDPRTFAAIGEVAAFLPDPVDPDVERAFLAVAAMMCAQPAGAREQELSARQAEATADDADQAENVPDNTDADSLDAPPPQSLGASCAKAVRVGASSPDTMEKRLHALCRANSLNIHRQLPGLITLVRTKQVWVDWVTLIKDLAEWNRHSRRIAAKWLRDYYRSLNTTSKKSSGNPEQEHA